MIKKIKYFPFLLFLLVSPTKHFCQTKTIDSLKIILSNAKNDSVRCDVLNNLIRTVSEAEKTNYAGQLKTTAENYLRNKTANSFFYKTQFGNAIEFFAEIFADQGDLKKANEYCDSSLKIMRQIGNKKGIANVLFELSVINITQANYSKAFGFADSSLKIRKEINDREGIASSLENVGNCIEYKDQNLEKAAEYYKESLKINEEINCRKGAAYSLGNLARIYYKQKNFEAALKNNFASLKIKEELNDKKGVSYSLHKIGQIYLQQGNIKEALEFGQKSLVLGRELGYPDNIKRSAELLNQVYKKKGDYKQASEMFELYILMRDSLNNMALQRSVLQNEYERQKQLDLAEQNKKDAIADETLKRKEQERNYFIAGFALVALFAVFILRGYRQKQKANKLILHQKEEVEKAKTLIEEQKKIVDGKQKEVLDSIRYAKRIQTALITSERYISKNLKRMNRKQA